MIRVVRKVWIMRIAWAYNFGKKEQRKLDYHWKGSSTMIKVVYWICTKQGNSEAIHINVKTQGVRQCKTCRLGHSFDDSGKYILEREGKEEVALEHNINFVVSNTGEMHLEPFQTNILLC